MAKSVHSAMAKAAICSNLAKACDKQMRDEEAMLFKELEAYWSEKEELTEEATLTDLNNYIVEDIDTLYEEVAQRATEVSDRGSLRCVTWGKKVTAIQKSLLSRYEKQKETLFESTNLYVCEACGFIALGEKVPPLCPICKAPSSRFVRV